MEVCIPVSILTNAVRREQTVLLHIEGICSSCPVHSLQEMPRKSQILWDMRKFGQCISMKSHMTPVMMRVLLLAESYVGVSMIGNWLCSCAKVGMEVIH